jgi:hypothetical protein
MKTSHPKTNAIEFKQDIPFLKKDLPLDQVLFSGGRTGLSILRHGGIGQILYFGRQMLNGATLFRNGFPQSAFEKLFRLCVVIDGTPFYPELNNTRLYPFGYVSECTLEKVRFEHELMLLNDAVVQRVRILSNPGKKKLSLKLIFHGFNRVSASFRKWAPWTLDKEIGALTTMATDTLTEQEIRDRIKQQLSDVRKHFPISDTPYGETHLGISSNLEVGLLTTKNNFKYYLTTGPFKDEASFFIAFSPEAEGLKKRVAELKKSFGKECDQLRQAFRNRIASSPKIEIAASKTVQSCLTNIPGIIDALQVKDIPGGYRASMGEYWIWLDLMLDTSGFIYGNAAPDLRNMLLLNKEQAAKDTLGVPCLITAQMKNFLGVPFHTQCVYNIALYNHYCGTGDVATLKEFYPLAKWIIERCLEEEVRGSGLIMGAGAPDHPADQDDTALNSGGNSWYYQALMCTRYLAKEMNAASPSPEYADFAATCDAAAKRCREGFIRYFYDKKKGFFVDSISSVDFSNKSHYAILAIQWVTPFAADLLGNHTKQIAEFMAKNFARPHGVVMFPTWDPGMPGDGNQWLAYYPSWSEPFYRSVMKLAGRERDLEKWYDIVTWFWERNTIPEGFTYDAQNEGFTPDNPGGKQGFGAQAWYSVFFRSIIGFEVDERGLVISPSTLGGSISVKNVVIRGKKIDIKVSGKGKRAKITFNGEKKKGPVAIIPFNELKPKNTLVIRKG